MIERRPGPVEPFIQFGAGFTRVDQFVDGETLGPGEGGLGGGQHLFQLAVLGIRVFGGRDLAGEGDSDAAEDEADSAAEA